MPKRSFKNVRNLVELIESAPIESLREFVSLDHCKPLQVVKFAKDEAVIRATLLDSAHHLDQDTAIKIEVEAQRVVTLASGKGPEVVQLIAQQLFDSDQVDAYERQRDRFGRSIWLRIYAEREFDKAESLYYASHYRGVGRVYDAFEIKGESGPVFEWNEEIQQKLESDITQRLELKETCELVHLEMRDEHDADARAHILLVRHAGPMRSVMAYEERRKTPKYYHPAMETTIIYTPKRGMVEVFAPDRSKRPMLAEIFAKSGFNRPISDRPITMRRYDLRPFEKPLAGKFPAIPGGKVERLWVDEMTVGIGHTRHRISLHLGDTTELLNVAEAHLGSNNPFLRISWISRVVLVIEALLDGEIGPRRFEITFSEPHRCNLQNQKDERLRRAGEAVLEHLGILRPVRDTRDLGERALLESAIKIMETAGEYTDGHSLNLAQVDIERLLDAGILHEGETILEISIEVDDDDMRKVPLQDTLDPDVLKWSDPISGDEHRLPRRFARRYRVDRDWLREWVIAALASALNTPGDDPDEDDPVFLGELNLDGARVPVYFATRLSNDNAFNRADHKLRGTGTGVGIVLTTSAAARDFLAASVIVPLVSVLDAGAEKVCIDFAKLAVQLRRRRTLAASMERPRLVESDDGHTATLYVPGKTPWSVSGRAAILILQRLVEAFNSGNPACATKDLMSDTGCTSPQNAFSKKQPWRDYIGKVEGARAWRLTVALSAYGHRVPGHEPAEVS